MTSNICNLAKETAMLEAARSGNKDALNEIIQHYEPEIRMIASKYFLPRADYEDLLQEGRIAIYRAILSYDEESGIPFLHFLRMVIKRKLIDGLRKYTRQKHANLNEAYSLNNVVSETEETSFLELLPNAEDPASTVIANDEVHSMIQDLNKNMSNLERLVFEHYFIQGFKQREVSEHLGLHPKSLDNAIQRIRHKTALYRSRQVAG
ncbi:sigma-70 family RNA polymerase sigma factor [Desulfosporosinus nitroreducens]|uniref:Sigma-70 family RNA polymerase sigma factor n=1 Tax=Desulfosporosinus nitroreducens TaxID=2018668 RepID=A0ABT8QJU7_9FIRM|nr:sigma-70 family RNA polymerase sigma factor [Desulfosporosinus nitroreducens]MCO1600306.1 sigma-70 family RNA polymerase sigma factor [Desulfosporosinus nitroreducens]MDA8222746.1 sigma-70 family RNA polymerase sigma factor [Desulfitobacterium hafniense]MDO0821395.1 sigma-70 family RNA polymerase sigma factor [Desulfosporosinus nitroreducens]